MNNNYPQIQELLHQRADYQARLRLLPYDGSPEIKDREGCYRMLWRRFSPHGSVTVWLSGPTGA